MSQAEPPYCEGERLHLEAFGFPARTGIKPSCVVTVVRDSNKPAVRVRCGSGLEITLLSSDTFWRTPSSALVRKFKKANHDAEG